MDRAPSNHGQAPPMHHQNQPVGGAFGDAMQQKYAGQQPMGAPGAPAAVHH